MNKTQTKGTTKTADRAIKLLSKCGDVPAFSFEGGIFKGLEFNGTEAICAGEKVVWNNETIGNGFPWRNVHRFRSTQHLLKYRHA